MNIEKIQSTIDEVKKPFILFLIGPPLSGKDTLLRSVELPDNVEIISRDQIVLDVWGSDDYDEAFKGVNQKQVDAELRNKFIDSNREKKSVIVNMTNMTKKRRVQTSNFFSDDYTKIAVIFPILEWEEYQRRNLKRQEEEKKFIPDRLIRSMISSYEPLTKEEGFDLIFTI